MNRVILSTGFILLFFLTGAQAQAVSDWQKYKDSTGRYTVLFPRGEVKQHVDTIKTDLGTVEYHTTFYFRGEDKGVSIYQVSWCDYPPGSIPGDSLDMVSEFFDATIETAAESVQGKVVYQDQQKVRGFPGRSWRINYNKGDAVLHSTAYLVMDRYYLLQSASSRAYSLSPEIEKFFRSFRLME